MTTWLVVGSLVLGAGALWLLLPRGRRAGRSLGTLLGTIALGLLLAALEPLGPGWATALFYLLAAMTLVSAVCTISFRNPVYCAVWFGLTLLGTAGLLFFQGAQFLGTATVIIYAGAILVTLLFVLMLANPRGQASYDRRAWEAPLAATVGAALLGVFLTGIFSAWQVAPQPQSLDEKSYALAPLGAELFSKHLIAVELAGTLLLAALAGAVAVVAQHAPRNAPLASSTQPTHSARSSTPEAQVR